MLQIIVKTKYFAIALNRSPSSSFLVHNHGPQTNAFILLYFYCATPLLELITESFG